MPLAIVWPKYDRIAVHASWLKRREGNEVEMPESDYDAHEVIEAYRKRRERTVPLLLGGLAVVLLVIGIFLVVIWLTGGEGPGLPGFLASDTPTPTNTATPLPPTATPTATVELTPSVTPTPEIVTYIVEIGDNLSTIADKFEVEWLLIMVINNLESPTVYAGQKLIIPSPGQEFPTPTPLPGTLVPGTVIKYLVMPGDMLQAIAVKYNSTVDAIIKETNKQSDIDIDDPNKISAGTWLYIPVGIATPVPTQAQ
jgi:LysM repeat protein